MGLLKKREQTRNTRGGGGGDEHGETCLTSSNKMKAWVREA